MALSERPHVFAIVGPTAVGKTACSIALAERLGAEILSFDARQFYRGLAIGTAQPSAEERAAVVHHLVDFLSPDELFSAGAYAEAALERIAALHASGHRAVVLVGGSGLYLKAVLEGLNELPASLPIRAELRARLEREGLAPLLAELTELDPVHIGRMDTANPQRVVRALEVCLASGRPFSSFHDPAAVAERPFDHTILGLEADRDILEARIRKRVEAMVAAGWEAEARAALPFRHENALQTVGYREWFEHIDGRVSRAEALEWIAVRTRQYAKRQLTWFKRVENVQWFEDCPSLLQAAASVCAEQNIPYSVDLP